MYKKIELKDLNLDRIPDPKGYKILVAVPGVEEKTSGGIFRPDQNKTPEDTASIVGLVVSVGPDAYRDPARYPTGAWCQPGDWILMRSYSGSRFKVDGQEYRLINDDTVEATVVDITAIARAGS